jgi:hypothetical protein
MVDAASCAFNYLDEGIAEPAVVARGKIPSKYRDDGNQRRLLRG